MQTMKFKFKRVFIFPACWYHSVMLTLIPFATSERFVDEMVKPMAPKPSGGATYKDTLLTPAEYNAALKASQEKVLAAWHKDVAHMSEYRIRYNNDGHYVITVSTVLSGSRKFIAPFKQQWPESDMTLMN